MSEASSKRRRRIVAIAVAVIALAAAYYLRRISERPPAAVRQTQVPPAATTQSETRSQPAATATAVDDPDVRTIVDQIGKQIKPIEWHSVPWDGQSRSPAETLEKAKSISKRFFDNFAKIETLKLHNEVVAEGLGSGKNLDLVQIRIDRLRRSLDVEITREPLFFKVSGIYASKALEATVTPTGKTQKGDGLGYVESLVPSYLDGIAIGFTQHRLGAHLIVVEDVTPDPELLNLPAVKDYNLDPSAHYDVLGYKSGDTGGVFAYWFNRETGMIDYKLHTKPEHADNENPYVSVVICQYKRAGDIMYPAAIDLWMVSDILEKPIARDFQMRCTNRFTEVEINGSLAE